jgi:hypothetical protein
MTVSIGYGSIPVAPYNPTSGDNVLQNRRYLLPKMMGVITWLLNAKLWLDVFHPSPSLDGQFSALTHQHYTWLLFGSILRTSFTFQICNKTVKVQDIVFHFLEVTELANSSRCV